MRTVQIITWMLLISGVGIAQSNADIIHIKELKTLLKNDTEKVRVINFWATWCAPCIKEMPQFEALNASGKDVEVILISLDFAENHGRMLKFLDKKDINSTVYLLDEIDYNSWIDKVHKDWSGAIPATIMLAPGGKRIQFFEGEFEPEGLEKAYNKFINSL